jgi:multidrug resistance efflux pump
MSHNIIMKNTEFTAITAITAITYTATACAVFGIIMFSHTAQASSRCVNQAGRVVAYVESPATCPNGSVFKGEVINTNGSAVNPADLAQSQAQAARDSQAVKTSEMQAQKAARAHEKNLLVAQKQANSQAKRCEAAELALVRAQDKLNDVPASTSVKTKHKKAAKASKEAKATQTTHTVIRDEDSKPNKAKNKAQHKLDAAQVKRDLACN